ncbi:MAG: adenylate/guanylate cyclase domain-containing protein [Colwellia sp.]|uniref:CHASE2 domain-containing protein n=1 Tax=Colwellia sp. TaxID=56799 RepID=UPI001D6B5731|nr:adenylate/guanylate cyclase domain-containing protein [Colwellia sp.]NQY50923.1 adenylate/guanylate cyclase domain-containing protein [Colwellia sp.]
MKLSRVKISSLLIVVFLITSYIIAQQSYFFKTADFAIFDRQSRYLAVQLAVDEDIVVIAIDDHSLKQMNTVAGRWVWPRTIHAQVIEALQPFALSAIVFDVLFAEQDIYRPAADTYFNEVLANSTGIYFATLEQNLVAGGGVLLKELPKELGLLKTPLAHENAKGSFILPLAINRQYWQLGSINFNASFDGVGRSYDVYRNLSGWHFPSLPAKLVSSLALPLPERQNVLLQWRGAAEQPYFTLSYVDIYQAIVNNNKEFLQKLSGKIVLIGATASGLYDARATPLSDQLPGVYMLATAIDNLKNEQYLIPVSDFSQAVIGVMVITLTCLVFILVSGYVRQVGYTLLLMAVISLILTSISTALLKQQQLLFIGAILLVMLVSFLIFSFFYGYLEYRRRQQALAMFGRFLDPQVVYKLLEEGALSPEQLNKKQTLTVLFSDIRNFTQLAENSDAEAVVKLLNQYFNQQVAIIFQHHGTLDKFIGDCVMAFWGAPIQRKPEQDAVAAINAALAMEQELLRFRQSLPTDLQSFDIGIGIHTGECIVGMIGADLRLDYTVIGDTVNLASRIEGLTKNNARILVSEQTKKISSHAFDFSYQGEHQVKGRQGKVHLYQPQRRDK